MRCTVEVLGTQPCSWTVIVVRFVSSFWLTLSTVVVLVVVVDAMAVCVTVRAVAMVVGMVVWCVTVASSTGVRIFGVTVTAFHWVTVTVLWSTRGEIKVTAEAFWGD